MTTCPELPDITICPDTSDIFCKIGVILTSSLQPKEVFRRVMKIIGSYFSPQNWSLLLMEEDTRRLKFEIVMGGDADKLKGVYIEKGEGIVGWVCENVQPVVVENAANDDRFSPRIDGLIGFTTKSVVCVPLLNGQNKIIGAIELINKFVPPSAKSASGNSAKEVIPTHKTFTETDMKILSSIGIFTGVAAENAFLFQRVKDLAMVDSLTGINNRLYFNEVLKQETERVKRYRHTMCMLMMDLDNFKKINDKFGHVTGDRVLRSIADILRVTVRESDILARFGGDEFVIIMPVGKKKNGYELAQRIQKAVLKWNAKGAVQGLKIGISIGVYEAGPDKIDTILMEADREMYQCKAFRKNPEELTSEEQMRQYLRYNMSQ